MKKRLPTRAKTRVPTQEEANFIKSASETLATESGFEKDWIEKKLITTLPDESTGFVYAQPPMLGLLLFKPSLFDAMKTLPEEDVEKYFGDELQKITLREATYNAIIEEVPFQSIEDAEEQLENFVEYLKKQSNSIIETGFTTEDFKDSPWLQRIFTHQKPQRYSDRHQAFLDFINRSSAHYPGIRNPVAVLPHESLIEVLGDAQDANL